MVNVAINGFGRIGRLVLRAGITVPGIRFVAINDLGEPSALAQLLRHDSVHGAFPGQLMHYGNTLEVNTQAIQLLQVKEPQKLPWKELNVDVVVESTGVYTNKEGLMNHINAGARKALLTAPAKGEGVKTIVLGVNEHSYRGEQLVSNASCTTNCFAPMAKVIFDNFGIKSGAMTTVHSFTQDQRLVDAPHKDLRRGKSASLNIVPTSTGVASAVIEVIPNLKGKIVASSIRVPTPDGSLCNFVAELETGGGAKEEVNELFLNVSKYHMKGILEYSEEELVSTDILGNPHSCIFDSLLTDVVHNQMLTVTGWYDNEWGYSNRVVEMIKYIMNH